MRKSLFSGLLVFLLTLFEIASSSPEYSGIFDPTSLLSKENIYDALMDSWEKPTDISETNVSTIFGDLLNTNSFSEANNLFPLSPYNSVSDEVLIRCLSSEGIVYNPETCPNLNCEQYPTSTDFKYYNTSSASTIRLALSDKGVVLGSALYTFDTSVVPSISLVNKFVIVLKTEDPTTHSKISIRLVSIARRGESGKNEAAPILRGSSFHSIEQNIVPGRTFYSIDIVGLFNHLPNEFELSQISVMILPTSPSTQVILSMESYAIARFYMSVDTIPIYDFGGIGEKAIQQSKFIQVRTSSVFGRSIIDYNDPLKARFNDYCPKTFGGQCLVQITSLKTTNAIGIFGFQLYLAGVVFAIKSAKIYIPVSVFKSAEQVVTDIQVSLLKPNFSITKLNYEDFKKSFEQPISSISVPLSLEPGVKTLIVDITKLFQSSLTLSVENVLISLSLPESYLGAIFTLNKAKITYQFDPSVTFQSMEHLNTQTFSNPNIASIETSFYDNSGKLIVFDSSLNLEEITMGNKTSISGNSAFVSQFSIPFITTESLSGMNITIVDKSKTYSSHDSISNSTSNSSETESPADLYGYETLDYTLSVVKSLRISNLASSNDLKLVTSKDFKLKLGGVTKVDVMELVKKAINETELNLGLLTFYGHPKSKESNHNLSLTLPFLEVMWNPGSSLSNGVISGGKFETKIKNLKLGELTKSNWSSTRTTSTVKLNSVVLAAFDFSKVPCLNTITSAQAKIEFSKFTANGEFEVFLMDKFNWNSSFTVEAQSFFSNPTQKYTSDKSIPPTLLAVPFVVDREDSLSINVPLTNVIGNGGASLFQNPNLGVIAFSTNSNDSEMTIKSVEITLKCSFNDGVYYNTAIV